MKILLPLVIALFILSNCSVQKRHYTKGFYVSHKQHKPSAILRQTETNSRESASIKVSEVTSPPARFMENKEILVAGGDDKSLRQIILPTKKKYLNPPDTCGDKIVYKNGDELLVKVFEVTETYIAYKPCDFLDGPLRKVDPANVFMIHYSNGTKEVIKSEAKTSISHDKPKIAPVKSKKNGFAVAAYILSFFTWFYLFPGILAIIFGIISLTQMNRSPDKYNNRWQANAAIFISLAIFALFVLVALLLA